MYTPTGPRRNYLDSSESVAGAAAVAYLCRNEIEKGQLGLGAYAEVFDAEMAALSIAAAKAELLTRDFLRNVSHIEIFTDNAAAVVAITTQHPNPLPPGSSL